jgi:hypothetical protein
MAASGDRASFYNKEGAGCGECHAAKIGRALERLGHSVSLVHGPSWRIFSLAERVDEVLAGAVFDTIIFAVLDNSTYNALAPNGDIIPARRDNMGKYHIDGELLLSSKSALFANFNALKPLLEKARPMGGVLMSPLPRYVKTGCCDDAEHMQDRNSAEFLDRMKSELREIAISLKNQVFTANMKFIKILDPAVALRSLAEDDIWESDPVHLSMKPMMYWRSMG